MFVGFQLLSLWDKFKLKLLIRDRWQRFGYKSWHLFIDLISTSQEHSITHLFLKCIFYLEFWVLYHFLCFFWSIYLLAVCCRFVVLGSSILQKTKCLPIRLAPCYNLNDFRRSIFKICMCSGWWLLLWVCYELAR